jgi:predicted glycosyltransferase
MADAGGMLTRDRLRTVIEAADRLEELDERVTIMSEPYVPMEESEVST